MDKFIDKTGGDEALKTPIATSAGVADADKIARTGADGKFDSSLLPDGLVLEQSLPASENLSARDLVNIWDDSGTVRVRKADNTDGSKPADGYVASAVTSGNTATVKKFGRVTGFSGLTRATKYYLGTNGGITTTAPSSSGNAIQPVGTSESDTVMVFFLDRRDVTTIA